jgi:long-chain acyl-CoA synthetase
MFGQQQDLQLQRATEYGQPPPKGQPYSVPIPGSQAEGRGPVYRHWRFRDAPLLETLDPAVRRHVTARRAIGVEIVGIQG